MGARISVVMATARRDYPMLDDIRHQFDVFLNSLNEQKFRDFELVLVDCLKDKRNYDFRNCDYPIKYIKPKPSYWLDNGYPAIGACYNTGFVHADGELIIIQGDCTEYADSNALDTYWNFYKEHDGKSFLRPIITYWRGKEPDLFDEKKPSIYKDWQGTMRRENLCRRFETDPKLNILPYSYYAHISISNDAIHHLNGFNELYDGSKGLIDTDLAIRFNNAGYKGYVMRDFYIREHRHEHFVNDKLHLKTNTPMILELLKHENYITANDYDLSPEERAIILEWHNTNKTIMKNQDETSHREWKYLPDYQYWLDHPPMFSLKKQWLKRREGKLIYS